MNRKTRQDSEINTGRRRALRGAAVFAVGAVLPLTVLEAVAVSKASKESMQYQDTPKNGQKCSDCVQFVPESNTCKVVAGDIDPNGYCIAFVAKSP